jgi:hypothetical protein
MYAAADVCCVPLSSFRQDFPRLRMRFQPVATNAIFWEDMCPGKNKRLDSLHQGLPITQGKKYGLNIWVEF